MLQGRLLLLVVFGLWLLLLLSDRTGLFLPARRLRPFDCISQQQVFLGAFFETLRDCRIFGLPGFQQQTMDKIPVMAHTPPPLPISFPKIAG
jgi:hypothetical protein